MKVAAVILNYNDKDGTIGAVRRIAAFDSIETVIVVDNASTDGSAEEIRSELAAQNRLLAGDPDAPDEECHRFMLVRAASNGGYGSGNNLGVQYAYEIAGAELVLIANPDAEFDEALIGGMISCFETDEDDVAAVGAVMEKPSGEVDLACLRASAWPLRSLFGELLNSGPVSRRLFCGRINYDAAHFKGKRAAFVDAVHGSLLMVDADRFMACGGYDEAMFLYQEENVLAWKLRENGYRTLLFLDGSYRHAGSGTITKNGHNAVRRQKLRQASERYYDRTYLGAGAAAMLLVRLWQQATLFETWAAERLHLLS